MPSQYVINVDLADVWDERGRKSYRRTVAWGDQITVLDQKTGHLEVEVTSFRTQPDGSLAPITKTGFIEPTKSSRIKVSDVVVPREQNRVLKVNFVDVQQGDGSVIEAPDGALSWSTAATISCLRAIWRRASAAPPQPVRKRSTASSSLTAMPTIFPACWRFTNPKRTLNGASGCSSGRSGSTTTAWSSGRAKKTTRAFRTPSCSAWRRRPAKF